MKKHGELGRDQGIHRELDTWLTYYPSGWLGICYDEEPLRSHIYCTSEWFLWKRRDLHTGGYWHFQNSRKSWTSYKFHGPEAESWVHTGWSAITEFIHSSFSSSQLWPKIMCSGLRSWYTNTALLGGFGKLQNNL